MWRTTRIALAIVVGLFVPATCVADTYTDEPYSTPQVAFGLKAAEAYWGQAPPCGQIVVTVLIATADGEEDGVAAIARAVPGGCHIWVDPERMEDMTEPGKCAVIVHEYGHLLGFGHTENNPRDPESVMTGGIPRLVCDPQARVMPERSASNDGRTRSRRRRSDRRWCTAHAQVCFERYPKLALVALDADTHARLEEQYGVIPVAN